MTRACKDMYDLAHSSSHLLMLRLLGTPYIRPSNLRNQILPFSRDIRPKPPFPSKFIAVPGGAPRLYRSVLLTGCMLDLLLSLSPSSRSFTDAIENPRNLSTAYPKFPCQPPISGRFSFSPPATY
jgi:hypothetical protein